MMLDIASAWRDYQDAKSRMREAQERFLGFFVPRILGLIKLYLHDRSQNEDVAISVWVSFLERHQESFERIQQPGELWEVFAKIAVRHCNKHIKRRRRQPPAVSLRDGPSPSVLPSGAARGYEPIDSAPLPDEQAIQHEMQEVCRALVQQCEDFLAKDQDPQRSARRLGVLAMHLAGAKRKDMAKEFGVSIPTIDRDLEEIRAVLGRLLEQVKADP
jgi:DNA-directed RNA polymerase specialized sigma24 family protein